jgi:hypothetical protein
MARKAVKAKINGNGKRARGTPKVDVNSPEHIARSRAIFALLRVIKGIKAKDVQEGAVYNDGTGKKNISLATVYNLRNKTRYPRFQTMEAVAQSAGYAYRLSKTNSPVE